MAAEIKNFLWVSKTFSANFLRAVYQAQLKFKEKQENQFLSHPLVSKTVRQQLQYCSAIWDPYGFANPMNPLLIKMNQLRSFP